MGCFFACFGSSKNSKRLKNHHHSTIIQRNAIAKTHQSSVHTLLDDSNNTFFHPVEVGNRIDGLEVASVKHHEDEHIVLPQQDVVSVHGKKQGQKEEEDSEEKLSKSESSSEDFVVPLNPNFKSSCPRIHRYRNCKDSDNEDEDEVFDTHLGSDENDELGIVESMKEDSSLDESSMDVCRLNPTNVRHRTAYVYSVLNPVENLSQWNAVKSKKEFSPKLQKENVELEQESSVDGFPYSSEPSREPCVDASLSNWLPSSQATPVSKITPTMALEATITPLKSGTLQGSSSLKGSGDSKMSEVGTARMYRRQGVSHKDRDSASSFKGIPNTTSKYREDKTVNWHSTPFETRLERALNSRGVAA
ncbi:DNA ligase 1 [Cucumis melo var. makuwa]|uniref:DNA ligase 1 n=1 Tax=Cucumis melo var. makuwa TaxID=1194695 RepID=A0A5D3DLV6_CUCMM|nr:DNA ligase 1 [Cucumis melo var. makuwa]TYK24617.1 DNA ligase 1 [Cucumis melo var. makuwa]